MPNFRPRPKTGRVVTCLGPAKKPHRFYSTDPGNRVCKDCRRMQDALRMSPQCYRPVTDSVER